MKGVARERPKTDRIACPWLIKESSTERRSSVTGAEQVLEVAEVAGAHHYEAPISVTHRKNPPNTFLMM